LIEKQNKTKEMCIYLLLGILPKQTIPTTQLLRLFIFSKTCSQPDEKKTKIL